MSEKSVTAVRRYTGKVFRPAGERRSRGEPARYAKDSHTGLSRFVSHSEIGEPGTE